MTLDNKIDGAVLMLVDIDELKRAEQKATEAHNYAQAIIEDASPLLVLDENLRVISSNQSFYNHFKVLPRQTEKILVYELGNGQWNIPQLREFLEDILPRNKQFKDFEITHEFETIGRRTMLVSGHRLDHLHEILLFIDDITERKDSENLQKELTEQLAAELAGAKRLQETSRHLIQGGDIDALYQQILEAAIAVMGSEMASMQMVDESQDSLRLLAWTGFDPEFGRTFELTDRDSKTICCMARVTRQRVIVPDVETCEFTAGTPALVNLRKAGIRAVQSTPLLSRSGQIIGIISTHWKKPHQPAERELRLLDVLARQAADLIERRKGETELNAAKEEISRHAANLEKEVALRTAKLQDSIKSLETLTYTMAHDLRAPIRAMKQLTGALQEDVPLNETGTEYAKNINEAAERMDQLVNGLLEYGQLTHLDFPIRAIDLRTEIGKVLDQLAREIEPTCAEIEVQEPLPAVLGNEMLLEQILSNLILNAVKFVARGAAPQIHIWAEEISRPEAPSAFDCVRLWIEDNGIGIGPEYQQKIFGVFQRLHTTEEFRGTGVGLAIVRRAVERMDGRVGVESKPGKGSRFWITLPKANDGG
jgi:signal transduction histidine kinase